MSRRQYIVWVSASLLGLMLMVFAISLCNAIHIPAHERLGRGLVDGASGCALVVLMVCAASCVAAGAYGAGLLFSDLEFVAPDRSGADEVPSGKQVTIIRRDHWFVRWPLYAAAAWFLYDKVALLIGG